MHAKISRVTTKRTTFQIKQGKKIYQKEARKKRKINTEKVKYITQEGKNFSHI